MKITIQKDIQLQDIADLLVCAFEGGSNYWYMIEKKKAPKQFDFIMDGKLINNRHYIADYFLNVGGAVYISNEVALERDEEKVTRQLNLTTIKRGLELMAEKWPNNYANFISGEYDAEDADIFLQLCIFDEVIYG